MDTIHYKLPNAKAFTSIKTNMSSSEFTLTNNPSNRIKHSKLILAKLLNIEPNQFIFANQTHSNNIEIITQSQNETIEDTDALITNNTNICLCILTADCTPVLLVDPVKKVIAAIHAGWKGTAKNITGKTIQKMIKHFSCKPNNIHAFIGPCISQQVYEVGENVFEEFKTLPLDRNKVFTAQGKQKYLLDLKLSNKLLLINEGLNTENIAISRHCTFTETDKFYSARKHGINTGRMISGIMLTD